jgi:hypothetical protein
MIAKHHWLASVEEILNAETGDLRELARIAGEDARTLFIGTSLNGTDLRGQDLRGLILTGLTLAKVKHDAATILDKSTGDSSEDATKKDIAERALVYFPYRYDARWLGRLTAALDAVRVFRPDEHDAFLNAVENSGKSTAAFVVLDYSRSRGLGQFLTNFGPQVTTLVTIRGKFPLSGEGEALKNRWVDGPVVLLPAGKTMFPGWTAPPVASAIQFISMATSVWPEFRRVLAGIPLAVFMWESSRKGGRGTSWARLLSRMHREDIDDRVVYRLTGHRAVGVVEEKIAKILLPDAMQIRLGRTRYLNQSASAAVLVDVSAPGNYDERIYGRGVIKLLSHLGWNVRSQYGGEYVIRGRGGRWQIAIFEGRLESHDLEWTSDSLIQGMPDVDEITICEDASVKNVVFNLIVSRQLLVSIADIASFDAGVGSFWFLIGLQLERLKSSSDFVTRTLYIRMILISAGMSSPERYVGLQRMLDSSGYNLFCTNYERKGPNVLLVIECRYDSSRGHPADEDIIFQLEITPDGPILNGE